MLHEFSSMENHHVLVVDYPRFFTPNGDGYNDTWHIIGGKFSSEMMDDWKNNDYKLLKWREETAFNNYLQSPNNSS